MICQICGNPFKQITSSHLLHKHNITMEEYRQTYPDAEIMSVDTREKISLSQSGENNSFYNKKHSEENKLKWSNDRKGKERPPFSKEWCENISKGRKAGPNLAQNLGVYIQCGKRPWVKIDNSGPNNPGWKGGISDWRSRMWRSSVYKNWRAAVFDRDDYTCQMCGDDVGGNLQAHHILPVKDHKNDLLLFDVCNGITLCKKCHESIYGKEYEYVKQFDDIIGCK